MSIIFNKNILIFILLSIEFIFALHDQYSKNDGLCGNRTQSVLCVKDVLQDILITAKSIHQAAYEIEEYIVNKHNIRDTLYTTIINKMRSIRSDLPKFQHHEHFVQSSNIDKNDFTDILLEAHDAMSFYYNSISDLLSTKDIFTYTTDNLFKEIQKNLRNDIICRYRSILDVYSYKWPLINQIKSIQISRRYYRDITSLDRDAHSIILTRLLRKWMEKFQTVIENVEMKLV